MKRLVVFSSLLAALLACPPAPAQQWCPPYPCAAPAADPCPAPCPGGGLLPPFAVELLGGQASGVRGQVPVLPGDQVAVVAEGFYGYLFHDLGSSQALGAGGRVVWQADSVDCLNSFLVGPGVDVYFQLNHDALILLAPSLDVAWMHRLTPGIGLEVGLDAGLGIGMAGRTKDGRDGLGKVTTLISGYVGLRF